MISSSSARAPVRSKVISSSSEHAATRLGHVFFHATLLSEGIRGVPTAEVWNELVSGRGDGVAPAGVSGVAPTPSSPGVVTPRAGVASGGTLGDAGVPRAVPAALAERVAPAAGAGAAACALGVVTTTPPPVTAAVSASPQRCHAVMSSRS